MQFSGESGSDWLHRLRASRGFPTDSSLDLEQFLNRPSSDIAAGRLAGGKDAPGAPDPVAGEDTPTDRPPGQDWYVLMTNVLSDLFNMGGGDRSGRPRPSKVPRKQPRPRVCAVSASASVGDSCAAAVAAAAATAMSPSSAENSVAAEGRESGKDGVEAPVGGAEEEISQMGMEDWEVGSYSKTTVTVIDTSEPFWRSEKVLFRKGDDWKICSRKGSSSHWSRKRRKLQNSEKGVGTNASVRECKALLPNEDSIKNTRKESIAEAAEARRQTPEKSCRLANSQLLCKPTGSDSCIHQIKCIPTNRKNECLLPKKRLNDQC